MTTAPLSPSTPMPSRRSRVARALAAATAAAVLAASPAAAQVITVGYDAACGVATPCDQVTFRVANPSAGALEIAFLRLIGASSSFAFRNVGGVTLFQAQDALGPFGGEGTLEDAARRVAIDFLAPAAGGAPFTLGAGGTGILNLTLAGAPALTGVAFRFEGTLADARQISGAIALTAAPTVVPEPSTVALVLVGLAGVAGVARRRRAA